jgi:8-oxo-dGTP pyrophosphatase MutT (NUDIX family)
MGAAAVVVFRDEMVLAVCDPDTRTLSLPGGHIESGETPEQAARWELLEETGVSAGILVPLGLVETTSTPCHMFFAHNWSAPRGLQASPEGFPMWVLPSELLERPRGPGYADGALQALSAAWRAEGKMQGEQHGHP